MNIATFGPVAEAAHGGQSSPAFDLLVGGAVLVISWFGYWKKDSRNKASLWALIGISVICAVFIGAGILTLLRH